MGKYFGKVRLDFPILKTKINGKKLIYVDNAATSQKPNIVIDVICNFYKKYNSNIHRGISSLTNKATEMFDNSRKVVADFVGVDFENVIFTSGATDSINIVARGLTSKLKKGDEILISAIEHHANLVTWQNLAKKTGAIIKYFGLGDNFDLDLDDFNKKLSKKTRIVAVSYASNVLGTVNNITEISSIVREYNKKENFETLIVVDATAAIAHKKIDFNKLNIDYLVFSSHKIYGPSGVGVLIGRKKSLELLDENKFGGGMIDEVFLEKSTFTNLPYSLEAGTPNIEGVVGFGIAIEYLEKVGFDKIIAWEEDIMDYFLEKINKSSRLKDKFVLYGKKKYDFGERVPIFSFNLEGIHSHDVSTILDNNGIIIRAGHHCAMPLHNEVLKIVSSNRISFSFYNTIEEIDFIIEILEKVFDEFENGDFLLN